MLFRTQLMQSCHFDTEDFYMFHVRLYNEVSARLKLYGRPPTDPLDLTLWRFLVTNDRELVAATRRFFLDYQEYNRKI